MDHTLQFILLVSTIVSVILLIYKARVKKELAILGTTLPRIFLIAVLVDDLFITPTDSFVLGLAIALVLSSDALSSLALTLSKQVKTEAIAVNLVEVLSELRSKFEFIVSNVPVGIFVINRGGFFEFVNDNMEEITGYSKEELLSMSVFDLMPGNNTLSSRRRMRLAIETSEGELCFEMPLETKTREVKRIKINAKRTMNGHETITGSIIVLGD